MILYGLITLGMVLLTEAPEGKGDIGKRRLFAIVGLIVKMKRNKVLDRVKAVYQKPAQNQQSKIQNTQVKCITTIYMTLYSE